MGDTLKYISKIEIKGLWGKFDLEWNLQPDVNVLSGINGSGKSTILNCVYSMVSTDKGFNGVRSVSLTEMGKFLSYCKISFNNEDYTLLETVKNDPLSTTTIEKKNDFFNKNQGNPHTYKISGLTYDILVTETIFPNQHPSIDLISTFDSELKSSEAINKTPDDSVKTELDWQIYHLNNRYIEYKLDIANKINEAISKNETNGELIKIQANQNRFLDILDTLFIQTGKKISRKENKISFLIGEEKISPYQLSSGEKELIVILLTVLVQDNKNAILFMDEPEISLHFDWQKELIGYIRELNPNVQIILATHSPAIIMDGWMDKVADVSDLIKPAYTTGPYAVS